jgi:hypothetical protein
MLLSLWAQEHDSGDYARGRPIYLKLKELFEIKDWWTCGVLACGCVKIA